jgi:hypothetical protein
MSGGSYDYVYSRIDEIEIRDADTNPRRAAFQKLLRLVAAAMHDIEWVDSGDYCPDEENETIDACFGFLTAEILRKAHAYDKIKSSLGDL